MDKIGDPARRNAEAEFRDLCSSDEMPEWSRRRFILHGYRPISNSPSASVLSWLYFHNESINIYSHLVPAIIFLVWGWITQQHLISAYPEVTAADFAAFSIFTSSAAMCLSLSAIYHTLKNHSRRVEHLCLRLDMMGVMVFILGDLALGVYIVFWCEPLPRNTYWSMVSPPQHAPIRSFPYHA